MAPTPRNCSVRRGVPSPARAFEISFALHYWLARYKNPKAKDSVTDACYAAREALREAEYLKQGQKLADATIIDIAREYQWRVLKLLESGAPRIRVHDSDGRHAVCRGQGRSEAAV
jgi:hypothetical protein